MKELNEAYLKARKERDVQATAALSTLKGDVENAIKNGTDEQKAIENLAAKSIKNLETFRPTGWERQVEVLSDFIPQQLTDLELETLVLTVRDENQSVVDEIKAGNKSKIGMLTGQVMKRAAGRVAPERVPPVLNKAINLS